MRALDDQVILAPSSYANRRRCDKYVKVVSVKEV
jgi:hypothetical protein